MGLGLVSQGGRATNPAGQAPSISYLCLSAGTEDEELAAPALKPLAECNDPYGGLTSGKRFVSDALIEGAADAETAELALLRRGGGGSA